MDRFDTLKAKYGTALQTISQLGVKLQNLHVQDDKLFIRGAAPSDEAKNKVWTEIKRIDPAYADLTCDLTVDPNLAPPLPAARTYTVVSGDTLSKISKQFYGDASQYREDLRGQPRSVERSEQDQGRPDPDDSRRLRRRPWTCSRRF